VITPDIAARLDAMLRGFGPEMRPTYFSYAEAAGVLGVSEYWLKTRVARNDIPYHRIGVYVRFTNEDLDTIRDSQRRGPPRGA